MHIRFGLKIGFLSLLAAAMIVVGVIIFQKLSHDKGVFETGLYTHIPSDITGILQINKEKSTKEFSVFFPELQNVLQTIESFLSYPILIAEQKESTYIISKITSEQESIIKSLLKTNLFPDFAPKIRIYKGEKIFFYPAENNRFFSCVFYQGFFVGGYNYTFLERFIDTDSSNNIFNIQSAHEITDKIKTAYPANLYFNTNKSFTSFNVNVEENLFELEGFISSLSESDKRPYEVVADNDSMAVDYSIFPDSLISYRIDTQVINISDSSVYLFDVPSYSFILNKDQASPIYALKYKGSRFALYDHLNSLEFDYIQRKFSTHDVVLGNQHIYMTSEQMGRNVFNHNSSVYLSFYKNYLLVSADRNNMVQYLKKNGNYTQKVSFDPVKISTNTISLFFSNDIQIKSLDYLDNYFIIKQMAKKQMCLKTYIVNGEKNIEMVLNY